MKLITDIFSSKYSKPVSSLLSNRDPCAEGAELRDGEWLWDPPVNTTVAGHQCCCHSNTEVKLALLKGPEKKHPDCSCEISLEGSHGGWKQHCGCQYGSSAVGSTYGLTNHAVSTLPNIWVSKSPLTPVPKPARTLWTGLLSFMLFTSVSPFACLGNVTAPIL